MSENEFNRHLRHQEEPSAERKDNRPTLEQELTKLKETITKSLEIFLSTRKDYYEEFRKKHGIGQEGESNVHPLSESSYTLMTLPTAFFDRFRRDEPSTNIIHAEFEEFESAIIDSLSCMVNTVLAEHRDNYTLREEMLDKVQRKVYLLVGQFVADIDSQIESINASAATKE